MPRLALILITLCVLPVLGIAQSVTYFSGTVYDALAEADRTGKLLLVEFYAPWSYKSRWLHDNVIAKSKPGDDFVVSLIDTQSESGAALANQYEVTDYPNVLIFNANGMVIDRIDKALSIEDFAVRLSEIVSSTDSRSMWQLRQILDAADRGEREQTEQLVGDYIASHKPSLLATPTHWDLFSNSDITYYGSTAYRFLKSNQEIFGKERVQEILQKSFIDAAMPYVIGVEPFNAVYLNQLSLDAKEWPVVAQLCDLAIMRNENSYDQYVQLLEKVIDLVPEQYEYQMVMSLDFVADGAVDDLYKSTRRAGSAIVKKLYTHTLSPAKISLIKPLLDKFL